MSPRRRNGSKKLTLVDFEKTGRQDCGNGFDQGDYDLTADSVDAWAAAEPAFRESEGEWIAQQSGDFDDLDPHAAFEAWLTGYRWCALAHLDKIRFDRASDLEMYHLYVGDDRDGFPVDSFETIEDAIDMLARVSEGAIWIGDGLSASHRLVSTNASTPELLFATGTSRFQLGSDTGMEKVMDIAKRFKAQRAELRRRGHRFVDKDTRS